MGDGAVDQVPQQALWVLALGDEVDMMQVAAEFTAALHQVHIEAGVGDGQRGGHPRDSPADDQGGALRRPFDLLDRAGQGQPLGRDAHLFEGAAGRAGRILAMDPGAVLAQVDDLDEGRVQAGFAGQALEERLMRAWAAGGDDQAIDPRIRRQRPHAGLSLRQTGQGDRFDTRHARQAGGVPGNGAQIDRVADLAGALAQRHADGRLGRLPFGAAGRGCRQVRLAAAEGALSKTAAQQGHGLGRSAGSVEDRLGDFFRAGKGPAHEDARAGGGQRGELAGFAESIRV